MGAEIKFLDRLKTAAKDFKATVNAEIQDWKTLPARVEEVNQFNQTKKPMEKTKTLSRRDFLKLAGTAVAAELALSACSVPLVNVVRTLTKTPEGKVPVVTPTNEKLGIQINEVAVWDKATLAAKDANVSAQIDALAGELRKQRPDLFVGNTQLESFAISVPAKDMTGKKTNTIYPFIVGNNQTDRNKSFVTIVLRRLDGQGIFAQSLTPVDIDVDGQQRGALVLPTSDTEQLPIFIFPKSLKDWNAQSDAQKVASDVIFIPPTGDRVKIPLSGGKLASPAVYNAQVGYATPGFNPDLATKASATDFYKTPAPTATLEAPKPTAQPTNTSTPEKPTQAPTQQPKPTERPTAIPATPKPENQPIVEADGEIRPVYVPRTNVRYLNGGFWGTETAITDNLFEGQKVQNGFGKATVKHSEHPEYEVGKTYYSYTWSRSGISRVTIYTIIP